MIVKVILTVTLLVPLAHCSSLPSYVKPCKRNDPKIHECAQRNAMAAIPRLINGDKSLGTPNLNPLKLPLIEISPGADLTLIFRNVVLRGLETVTLDDIKCYIDKRQIQVHANAAYVNLIAEYEMKGKIAVIPIAGKGNANITLDKCNFVYTVNYDIVKKNGKDYISNLDDELTYSTARSHYDFENLFNGNKQLGDETNKFLNENYKEVSKELSPSVSVTIKTIINSIISALVKKVPYDEIFLP